MPTEWTDFLDEIRSDLQDTSGNPRWTDTMLWVYAKDAIRDYSMWFPRRMDQVALTPINGKYLLPTDFIEDIYVECPLGTFLERRRDRPGVKFIASNKLFFYTIDGGYLYTTSTPTQSIYLTYQGVHPVPDDEDGGAQEAQSGPPAVAAVPEYAFTIPDADMELIRLYMRAKVYDQMRSRQASLDRFKLGTGTREDNPIMPEVREIMDRYYEGIALRTSGGPIILNRTGRMK
jgi:hypothetical protein